MIPTYNNDAVQSVSLNSYKKLEKKGDSDFYKLNFEVLVKRNPAKGGIEHMQLATEV